MVVRNTLGKQPPISIINQPDLILPLQVKVCYTIDMLYNMQKPVYSLHF